MTTRIRVEIGELVLDGFDYHDHRRIAGAFEQELGRLIRERGLPGEPGHDRQTAAIAGPPFAAPSDMNAWRIGVEAARSVYRGLGR